MSDVVEFFALCNDVNRISHTLVQRAYDKAGVDVTTEQWQTMGVIYDLEGASTMEIARQTLKNKGAVARVLAGLEKRGLIVREYGDKANTFKLQLTDKGHEIIQLAYDIGDAELQPLVEKVKVADIKSGIKVLEAALAAAKKMDY
jgi:DNA-binding MarR family transcriptional regulator